MSTGSNPVFPIIKYNYSVSYVTNLININKSSKNLFFKIVFTKNNFKLIQFFKNCNLIFRYKLVTLSGKNYIQIYLYFNKNSQIASVFKILSKPSKKFFISYKSLRLLSKRSGTSSFFVSTSKGIIIQKEALKRHTSGFLLGFMSL